MKRYSMYLSVSKQQIGRIYIKKSGQFIYSLNTVNYLEVVFNFYLSISIYRFFSTKTIQIILVTLNFTFQLFLGGTCWTPTNKWWNHCHTREIEYAMVDREQYCVDISIVSIYGVRLFRASGSHGNKCGFFFEHAVFGYAFTTSVYKSHGKYTVDPTFQNSR